MSSSWFKKKEKIADVATIKQDVIPAVGQKYKTSGQGFIIQNIVDSIAICKLTNGQIKHIGLDKIPTFVLDSNSEERPRRKLRFGY